MQQENQFASEWFNSRGIKSWVNDDQVYIEVYGDGDTYEVLVSNSEVLYRADLYKSENDNN